MSADFCRLAGNLDWDDEHNMDQSIDTDAMRISVAEVLQHECDRETVLHHVASGRGPMLPLWDKVVELGWLLLNIPEEHGGLGLGRAAIVPIYEELGRVAAPLPFLVTVLAAESIVRGANDEQKSQWLERIGLGAVATISPPAGVLEPTLSLTRDGSKVVLSGTAPGLLDAEAASLLLVLARDKAGALFRVVVEPEDGAMLETQNLWDRGHTVSSLRADQILLPADRCFPTSVDSESELLAHAALGLAAESVGGAQGILDLTISYMKTREQFGRPIGSFQALKHRAADHSNRAEAASHLLRGASDLESSGSPDWRSEASAAKALACDTFAEIARDCIQLHGGIGFTAEQACHLYLKRANLNAQLFGDQGQHLDIATSHLMARR